MAELINKKGTFASGILRFYAQLRPDFRLPEGVEVLMPYPKQEVKAALSAYYHKYYGDANKRFFIIGINPGRFGGGITGIPFTDPIRLKESGIEHPFPLKPELSSVFVYNFIDAYGGIERFAKDFFLTAISPVGFTRNGKNYNYYDDPQLEEEVRPWLLSTMKKQLAAGADRSIAICLGEGTNFKYLSALNKQEHWFEEIVPLPHPRWIMQYNRKNLPEHISRYVSTLQLIVNKHGR